MEWTDQFYVSHIFGNSILYYMTPASRKLSSLHSASSAAPFVPRRVVPTAIHDASGQAEGRKEYYKFLSYLKLSWFPSRLPAARGGGRGCLSMKMNGFPLVVCPLSFAQNWHTGIGNMPCPHVCGCGNFWVIHCVYIRNRKQTSGEDSFTKIK